MEKRNIISAACAVVAMSGSVASAGFIISATRTPLGSIDQIDLFALNNGVGTGTKLAAVNLNYVGAPTSFRFGDLDEDPGTPNEVDLVNAGNAAERSFLRIGTASNTFVVGASLKISGTPASFDDPRWGSPVTNFSAAYAFTGAPVAANTGSGARFARLYVPASTTFALNGSIGGEVGSEFPFVFPPVDPPLNSAPIIQPGATANVQFGTVVSNGAPFSVVVNAFDANPADLLSLAVGSVAGISNVVVSPATSTAPAAFTISGTVHYSLSGTTVVIPVAVTDGIATVPGSFSLVVTPEPSTLAMLVTLAASARRRRRI